MKNNLILKSDIGDNFADTFLNKSSPCRSEGVESPVKAMISNFLTLGA